MTILTKQTVCDEKAPVKIAIPPEHNESEETDLQLNNNNNNIVHVSQLLILTSLTIFAKRLKKYSLDLGLLRLRVLCEIKDTEKPSIPYKF